MALIEFGKNKRLAEEAKADAERAKARKAKYENAEQIARAEALERQSRSEAEMHAKIAQAQAGAIQRQAEAEIDRRERKRMARMHQQHLDVIKGIIANDEGDALGQLVNICKNGISGNINDDSDYKELFKQEKETAKQYLMGYQVPTDPQAFLRFMQAFYSNYTAIKDLEESESMKKLRKNLLEKAKKTMDIYFPTGMEVPRALLKEVQRIYKKDNVKDTTKSCLIKILIGIGFLIALFIAIGQSVNR